MFDNATTLPSLMQMFYRFGCINPICQCFGAGVLPSTFCVPPCALLLSQQQPQSNALALLWPHLGCALTSGLNGYSGPVFQLITVYNTCYNAFPGFVTNHFMFKHKSSKFMSSPRTKTHLAGKNDPEVGRLPILRHCCCSHRVSELTSDGWLLYIFSLYSATCFSGYFSN